jgi:quinoprotein dehydrogenase-associated probable ABC transporter substrate-binding protein
MSVNLADFHYLKVCAAFSVALFAIALAGEPARSQTSDLVVKSELRVCADPANMPFTNQKGEGFENKIADVIGKALNIPVTYFWFPQATGFIRNTLRAKKCDIVMGYVQGHELVQNTNHYYTSAYVIVTRTDSDLSDVESLDDPRLHGRKIGVVAGTPPATNLAVNGLLGGVHAFHLNVDRRFYSPAEDMVKQIASKELDVGLLWGPIGGYYAKQQPDKLKATPLVKEKGGPKMVYRITMGVRPTEQDWKRQINRLIKEHQGEIDAILDDYAIPRVEE